MFGKNISEKISWYFSKSYLAEHSYKNLCGGVLCNEIPGIDSRPATLVKKGSTQEVENF